MSIIDPTGFNWKTYISPHVQAGLDEVNGYNLGIELGLVPAEIRANDLSYFTGYANDRSYDNSYRSVIDTVAPSANSNPITGVESVNGLAYLIKTLLGTANWYVAPTATIPSIVAALDLKAAIADRHIAQWNADKLRGLSISSTAPTDQQILSWDAATNLVKWVSPSSSGGVAGVSKFNNRTGDVIPANNDYSTSQIAGLSSSLQGDDETLKGYLVDHCLYQAISGTSPTGVFGFLQFVAGTGANASPLSVTAGRHGIFYVSTGTTATGSALVRTFNSTFLFGACAYSLEIVAKVQIAANATDPFRASLGFIDSSSTASAVVDGAKFFTDASSTFWQCRVVSNSVATTVVTNVAVTNTWNKFKISVNKSGSSVAFHIDGVLVATITTNIPITAGRETGMGYQIVKSAGTGARTLEVDFIRLNWDAT